jgi:uncharacterized protein (TIGR00290 family)
MTTIEKVLLTWSGGKDSAMALHALKASGVYEVLALLTTVTEEYDRVSMHGVRTTLLERQAESLGLPVEKMYIGADASNEEYEARMRDKLVYYQAGGVSSVAFGDLFLGDVRRYREENLSKVGMKGLFPLWGTDTSELAHSFIDLGFKAVVTCVDSNLLDGAFVGREFDEQFLAALPPAIDPCGENGEFHTFVYDGPLFRGEIPHKRGEVVLRDSRFYYCDLTPI